MKPLLLFVDDDPTDAELACHELAQAGIDCDWRAVCAEDALLQAMAERMPDAVLVDIVLPQWSLWDVWAVLQRSAPGLPVIIYSGTVSVEDIRLAKERQVFGWCEKDCAGDLVRVVRLALEVA